MKRSVALPAAGAVVALAATAAAMAWLADDPVAPPAQPPRPVVAVAPPAAAPAPAVATPAPAVAAKAPTRGKQATPDRARELELPDGTFVPTLNGAVDAAPLATYWGPTPWSPITGVERSSAGVDWYRHEDGSYSTTQMVWRKDLGREAAMTRVAHPGPAAPVATAPAAAAAAR